MKMHNDRRINVIVYYIFMTLLFQAIYAHVAQADQLLNNNVTLTTDEKLNIKIKLLIPDEFRNLNYENSYGGSDSITPIGKQLVNYSKQILLNTFTRPIVSDRNVKPEQSSEADYILTPKLIFIKYVHGGSAWDEARMTVCIEWTLSSMSGKIKWKENVIGHGIGKTGSAFSHQKNVAENLSVAIQNTFEKTQKSMLASNILKQLSKKN